MSGNNQTPITIRIMVTNGDEECQLFKRINRGYAHYTINEMIRLCKAAARNVGLNARPGSAAEGEEELAEDQ